jgi:hypothetical protein
LPHPGRAPLRPFFTSFLLTLFAAPPASAFGPHAATAIISRLSDPSPTSVAWEGAWVQAARARIENAVTAEAADPESSALRQRYDAVRPRADLLRREDGDEITGLAPFVFAASAEALEAALLVRDDATTIAALADLASGAADLADPFFMSPPDPAEIDGARHSFCDVVESASLLELEPTGSWSGEPLRDAVLLARQSAALRSAVEDAMKLGNVAVLEGLRCETLSRALGLARAVAERAWQRAGSPSPSSWTGSAARVWPNPVLRGATIQFLVRKAGEARLELFDLGGRRVLEKALGRLDLGARQAHVGHSDIDGLPPGVYQVRVLTAGGTCLGRLLRGK